MTKQLSNIQETVTRLLKSLNYSNLSPHEKEALDRLTELLEGKIIPYDTPAEKYDVSDLFLRLSTFTPGIKTSENGEKINKTFEELEEELKQRNTPQ